VFVLLRRHEVAVPQAQHAERWRGTAWNLKQFFSRFQVPHRRPYFHALVTARHHRLSLSHHLSLLHHLLSETMRENTSNNYLICNELVRKDEFNDGS